MLQYYAYNYVYRCTEPIKFAILNWLKDNIKVYNESEFEFDFNTAPVTVNVKPGASIVMNENITSLTTNMFQWGKVGEGNYCCVNCHSLSLDNVSEKIREKVLFNCEKCDNCGLFGFVHLTLEDNAIKDISEPYVGINDKYKCATPEFVEKVKEVYLNKVMPSIRDMRNSHWLIKYLICIIKNIPIHFGKQGDDHYNDDSNYLGLYQRINDQREIILFEDAIKAEAIYCKEYDVYDNEYLENLIWKVIIHEYAHAMMDTLQDNKLKKQDSKLYKYREESLANAFALKVLKSNKFGFRKIEDFVKSQPEEYKHGLDLYKREDLLKMMEFWREMKIEGNKRF